MEHRLSTAVLQLGTADEVVAALGRIDKLLADAGNYGVRTTTSPDGEVVGIDIAAGLLWSRRMAVERLTQLGLKSAEAFAEDAGTFPPDPSFEERRKEQAEALQRAQAEWQTQKELEAAEERRFERRVKEDLHQAKLEQLKWSRRFAKESVATIVGAGLLVVLAIGLLVAMFTGVNPSELLSNAFLIILGYFFGQSSHRRSPED